MKKFIHEGTGKYWDDAVDNPAKLARWIIVRTYDENDLVWKEVNKSELHKYTLVETFPFANIYELKEEYLGTLVTDPIYPNQK